MNDSLKALLFAIVALSCISNSANATTNAGDFGGVPGTNSGVAIGTGYANTFNAPTNGLIVQGNVGIGTASPQTALDAYNGDVRHGNTFVHSLTRAVPTTVGNYIEIGNFNFTNGAGSLWVSITVPSGSYSVSKEYLLPIQYNQTNNVWQTALPLASTGPFSSTNDFALDVNVTNATAYLRLRDAAGTTSGTAYVTIRQEGINTDSFTATSATGSNTPSTTLVATPLTLLNGNAGIGLTTPAYPLDVYNSNNSAPNYMVRLQSVTTNGGSSNDNALMEFYHQSSAHSRSWMMGTGSVTLFGAQDNFGISDNGATSGTFVIQLGGDIGIGTTSPLVSLDLTQKTDAIALPSGNTSQRPPGTNGDIRYNNAANAVEAFVNGLWTTLGAGVSASTVINSSGRLKANGTGTGLTYCPYKGNLKTTANYGIYTIPSACLTATLSSMYIGGTASQVAAASTLYYVYLINVSGTTFLDLETTGHATDSTTGIEIMSGNNTRTLVGMIHTDANSKAWNNGQNVTAGDTNTVATWDNRVPTSTRCGFTTIRSLTNSGLVEINSENRCYFMSWADSATFSSDMVGYPQTTNTYWNSQILLDGSSLQMVSWVYLQSYNGSGSNTTMMVGPGAYTPSEGYHYTTLYGSSPAGTVSWSATNSGTAFTRYIYVSTIQ